MASEIKKNVVAMRRSHKPPAVAIVLRGASDSVIRQHVAFARAARKLAFDNDNAGAWPLLPFPDGWGGVC